MFSQVVNEAIAHPILNIKDACDLEGSIDESNVRDEVKSVFEPMHDYDGKPNVVEVIDGDPTHEDVANVYTPDPTFQEIYTSASVVIAENDVPESVNKVANGDCKKACSTILIDNPKLFDIVDVFKSESPVPKLAVLHKFGILSYFHYYTSTGMLFVKRSPGGLCLWFNGLSPIQKHEWEPPP
ncbi:unnamed protein product [Cuscuta campestris]|uniref:Uncharacterized protein n=1 Tax=Cuscuta campestris TaxID=132261 RepID=A0A484KZH8_9ASTE|nr:unnamed protein product [Cuscuta campestris]